MRESSYTDKDGRQWMVKVPEDSTVDASAGIPVGPPSLLELGLPKDLEVELHNQLFSRKIWTSNDIKRRRPEVIDAIRHAYKMDSQKIYVHYLRYEGKL